MPKAANPSNNTPPSLSCVNTQTGSVRFEVNASKSIDKPREPRYYRAQADENLCLGFSKCRELVKQARLDAAVFCVETGYRFWAVNGRVQMKSIPPREEHAMRYGLCFPNGGACDDPRTFGEFAHLAEQAGWDGAFIEDYIVWQGHQDIPTYDPWLALAAMALSTHRIRLGTMVTALPRRRPWKVARETVTLDHLSNGRLILGVGLGDTSIDISFTHFGEITDIKQRAKMLDEGLEILAGLWSGQPFSYQGEYYHLDQVRLLPRPIQTPRIPIWVGGAYPNKGPMRRAARWDGACLYKVTNEDMTPADVRALKAFVDSHRTTPGPFDIALGGRHRGDDWEQERALIRSLAEAGATWWVEYLPPQIRGFEEMGARVERGPLRIE